MHVKIWSKDHCPYCVMAVKACAQLSDILDDFEYEVVKLGVDLLLLKYVIMMAI